jgi:hypothetical protein
VPVLIRSTSRVYPVGVVGEDPPVVIAMAIAMSVAVGIVIVGDDTNENPAFAADAGPASAALA